MTTEPVHERLSAWTQDIDLSLLNAALQLAVCTTTRSSEVPAWRHVLSAKPWYEQIDSRVYFEAYRIRYLGELLERYEEKFGTEPRVMRAVALALALAKPIETDAMIIGSQKRVFLKKLRRAASSDAYLLAALYLIEPDEQRLNQLQNFAYHSAAEIIFVLNVMESEDQLFEALLPHLKENLNGEHALPVYGNAGLFAALLGFFVDRAQLLKRKKNMLFMALSKLYTSYVRQDSTADRTLREAGYTRMEICYLNAALLQEPLLHGRLDERSTPAARLAIEFLTTVLNLQAAPPPEALALARMLLEQHHWFKQKIEGCHEIWEVVEPQIHPCVPETVAWIYTQVDKRAHLTFDALDPKWDKLTTLLDAQDYHTLFGMQLSSHEIKDYSLVPRLLRRYQELTGTAYEAAFEVFQHREESPFGYLVDAGVISLIDYFEKHSAEKSEDGESCLNYVSDYAKSVPSRAAFEFWTYFFQRHSMQELPHCFPRQSNFHSAFMKSSRYYGSSYEVGFTRDFLTDTEQRQLYEWIDESYLTFCADKYPVFLSKALVNEDVRKLYTQEELRDAYMTLASAYPQENSDRLKKLYLTEEELAENARVRAEEERQEKLLRQNQQREVFRAKLEQNDDGSFHSLREIAERCYYSADSLVLCELLIPHMEALSKKNNTTWPQRERADLFWLCAYVVKHANTSQDIIMRILERIREVKSNHDESLSEP